MKLSTRARYGLKEMCIRDRNYNATTFRKEKVKNKIQLQRELGLEAVSYTHLDVYKRQV